MLIDDVLPDFTYSLAVHRIVEADPASTFDAISRADLGRDSVIRLLIAARELPNRFAGRRRGDRPTPTWFTFDDIRSGSEWVELGEIPGRERVAGSIGQFWKGDYGWAEVSAANFARFDQPGYAKTVAGLSVRPYGEGRTLLTMESRTAVTDETARRRFGRYWGVLRPFVRLLMNRALQAVQEAAEHHYAVPQHLIRIGA